MVEKLQPRAQVFKHPITKQILEEFGDRVTGEYTGVQVGVSMDNQVIWHRNIYPIFILLHTALLLEITKPF